MNTVTIGRKTYTIQSRRTVDEVALVQPHLAEEMRKYHIVAEVALTQPKSRKVWLANEWQSGRLNIVIGLG